MISGAQASGAACAGHGAAFLLLLARSGRTWEYRDMRFFLNPPTSYDPSLIVETHRMITPEIEERLRSEMYGRSCANGMLFDDETCLVLRDSFENLGPQSVRVDLRLRTEDVLRTVQGNTLDDKVQTWLELLSASWHHAIPPNQEVAELVYDIVPAAVGTQIQIVQDQP